MYPAYMSSFTVLIKSIRNGNTMEFSEFSKLKYAHTAETDKRVLLKVVKEIRHAVSKFFE